MLNSLNVEHLVINIQTMPLLTFIVCGSTGRLVVGVLPTLIFPTTLTGCALNAVVFVSDGPGDPSPTVSPIRIRKSKC